METIVASVIAATGLVTSTLITTRRTKRIESTLGVKNGQGSVTDMLENLIEWKGSHTRDHQHLDEMFGSSK